MRGGRMLHTAQWPFKKLDPLKVCIVGYSDFYDLMVFPNKKMTYNIFKLFVNKVFLKALAISWEFDL